MIQEDKEDKEYSVWSDDGTKMLAGPFDSLDEALRAEDRVKYHMMVSQRKVESKEVV